MKFRHFFSLSAKCQMAKLSKSCKTRAEKEKIKIIDKCWSRCNCYGGETCTSQILQTSREILEKTGKLEQGN